MIEALKKLKPGAMLTIDAEVSKDFTNQEDFVVEASQEYNCDGTEVVIVTLGDFTLTATNISGDTKFSICEHYDDGDSYVDGDDFFDEIEVAGGEGDDEYQKIDAVYACDEGDTAFGEYTSSCHFNYILIHTNKDGTLLYRGIEVTEDQIIL